MAAFLPAAVNIGSSLLSSYLNRDRGSKETPIQKGQRKTIDEVLASLKGNGPYADLFRSDQEGFQKSVVDPSIHRFNSQIAPQIQQQYIAGGMQNGTGMQDALTRAGVDLNSNIDQLYLPYMQGAQNRAVSGLSGVLSQGPGVNTQDQSGSEAVGQGFAGYLSSPSFGKDFNSILEFFKNKTSDPKAGSVAEAYRPGFVSDIMGY